MSVLFVPQVDACFDTFQLYTLQTARIETRSFDQWLQTDEQCHVC